MVRLRHHDSGAAHHRLYRDLFRPEEHAVRRLAALGAVLLALAGCGTLGSHPGIQGNINTAQTYVDTGFGIVSVCIAAHLPICASPSFVAGVAQARAVVDEAMQQARDIAASDPTQAQTLLRVAMNAVLLFYSLKP